MIFFFNQQTAPEEGAERYYDPKELSDLGLDKDVVAYYKLKYGAEWAGNYFFDKLTDQIEFWDFGNEDHVGIEWEEGELEDENEPTTEA